MSEYPTEFVRDSFCRFILQLGPVTKTLALSLDNKTAQYVSLKYLWHRLRHFFLIDFSSENSQKRRVL